MHTFRWLLGLLVLLFGLDRMLKYFAVAGMVRVVGPMTFARFDNHGLVFSFPAPMWFSLIVMLVAVILITWLLIRGWQQKNNWVIWAGGLMLIGAVSNILDRLLYGAVIDWANFGPHWPIFNLADVLIAVGLIVWISAPRLTEQTQPL